MGAQLETADSIITPIWTQPLQFHTGGVVKLWGPMECSKTRSTIAILDNLVHTQNFQGNRIFSNTWIDIPGAHWLRNDELRAVLRRAFNTETGAGRWNKCIFALMDADDVYSHVTQADQECYRDIKKASQAYKRNMFLFYEVHEGLAVPKYLRDKTEISIRPVPDERRDMVTLYIADGHYLVNYTQPIHHISAVNGRYRRFDENY